MPDDKQHILSRFQEALDEINGDLKNMALSVEKTTARAVQSLLERNTDLANTVFGEDEEIDQMQMRIDDEGMKAMVLYQPVASDLRRIVAVMKVAADLERVGDHAVNIAKRARKMNKHPEIEETALLSEIQVAASAQLHQAIQTFIDGDTEKALMVIEGDKKVNELCKKAGKQLTQRMSEDAERAGAYMHLSFIVRDLERIGDHAKNICEDTVLSEDAIDIRHGGLTDGE